MADRDVERYDSRTQFAETLRRVADAVENEESFRIQILNERFTIPADAQFSIEHERESDEEEVEFQFRWRRA